MNSSDTDSSGKYDHLERQGRRALRADLKFLKNVCLLPHVLKVQRQFEAWDTVLYLKGFPKVGLHYKTHRQSTHL